MKLAIVTDSFPPDVNGVAMTLERLNAGMIGRGHEVEVVHPGVSGMQADAPRLTVSNQSWDHLTRDYERWLMRAAGLDPVPAPSLHPHPIPATA